MWSCFWFSRFSLPRPDWKDLPPWNRLSSDLLLLFAFEWLFFLDNFLTLPMSSVPSAKAWYELFHVPLSQPPMVELKRRAREGEESEKVRCQ